MYKILIRKGNSTKPIYYYYTVSSTTEEGEVITEDYETDDLQELESTVEGLLELFKLSDIKAVKELDIEVLLTVNDN
jgi:hypothetical protein